MNCAIDWKATTYRLARKHGGQHRLAEKLGVHRMTIAHLSSGETKAPSFNLGLRLLAAYSQDVEPIPGAAELAAALGAVS